MAWAGLSVEGGWDVVVLFIEDADPRFHNMDGMECG
jgi:hypothetical protein